MRDAFRDTAPEKSRLTTSYLVLLEQRKRLEQELRCVRLEKERLQKEKRNLEAKILIERKRREKKGRYVQKAVPVAGDNGKPIPRPHEEPLLPVKWQFGELPQVRTRFQLPADLPERLAVLLHVPPAMLRQLSLVKLRILARLYLKIFPKDHRTEDDLCEIMHTAIGAMVPGWQAATPHYVYGSRWNASVRLCIHHWLDGWAAGSTGRALNVCCHEACVVSADFLQVLSNPPDSLMNVFVTASMRPNIGLDALMVLLCARVVLVEVQDMPTDAKSLHQAVKAALVAAALRLEGIQRGPLLELQESATFGRMVYAIQSQLAVPLIVAFNGMQAIGYKEYERLFASTLDEFPRDVPSAILEHPRHTTHGWYVWGPLGPVRCFQRPLPVAQAVMLLWIELAEQIVLLAFD
ncbi:g5563 [Coccomyxa viridis]|uniref:G5563 protein n=1 Tax=Coccomyxa viridis TaxID=1274662 RepID=A0ABP1FVN7_9CHLO